MRTTEETIFWEVHSRQGCLRSEIAARFTVSLPTISRAVDVLLKKGLLVEKKPSVGSLGRRPGLLQVNPGLAVLLGLEIDRDRVTAVVTDMAGTLLGRGRLECDAGGGLGQVTKCARRAAHVALADAGIHLRQVNRIGIGHPGPRDESGGTILSWPGVRDWQGAPLRQTFSGEFGLPATLDDRSRALALGERYTSLDDRDHPNALYIHAGTGIGAGIFLDGRLWRGSEGLAGEVGHQIIERDGPPCVCGNKGCVEAVASIGAVLRYVREKLGCHENSELLPLANANPDALTIEAVATAARRGDPVAVEALDRAAEALAIGAANTIKIFNPSLVVISGRLARAAREQLTQRIQEIIRAPGSEILLRGLEIRIAEPKKDIAAVGCALLAAEAEAQSLLQERLHGQDKKSVVFFSN